MQVPRKYKWAESILSRLSRAALLRYLDEVYLRADDTGSQADGMPTIYYANHVCIWDGHLAIRVTKHFHRDFYVMVSNRVMQIVPFLSWIGCFEVDRSDSFAVKRSIEAAAEILKQNPPCGMWIFPQGMHKRNDFRPLGFLPGLAQIIGRTDRVCVTPVAIRYEMFRGPKLTAFVSVGKQKHIENSKQINPTLLTQELERRLTEELDNLTTNLLNGTCAFFPILRRNKNVILCRGRKFYKKEIEAVLRRIKGVKKAKVNKGVHPLYGDAIEAHIERETGTDLDENLIKQRIRQILGNNLADFILPAVSVVCHDELPKSNSNRTGIGGQNESSRNDSPIHH